MDAYNYIGTFAWTLGTIAAIVVFVVLWCLLVEGLSEAERSKRYFKCAVLLVLLILMFALAIVGTIAAQRIAHPVKPACTQTIVRGRTSTYVITHCPK